MNDLVLEALACSARGFYIFPVRPKGKIPLIVGWQQQATTDRNKIMCWLADQYQGSNIGILTGPKSGILVLDVDPRNDGDETLKVLEKRLGNLPRSPRVLTGGGGYHLYFKYPTSFHVGNPRVFDGIDIKGEGGFVVAPKSVHPSGRSYEWDVDFHPDDIALAELPIKWKASMTTDVSSNTPILDVAKILSEGVREGHRNNFLFHVCIRLARAFFINPKLGLAIAEVTNKCLITPSLSNQEVHKTFSSAMKYVRKGKHK